MIVRLKPSHVHYTVSAISNIYEELDSPLDEVITHLMKYLDCDPCSLPLIGVYTLGDRYYTTENAGLYILRELESKDYLPKTVFKDYGKRSEHMCKFTSVNGGKSVKVCNRDSGIISEEENSSSSDGPSGSDDTTTCESDGELEDEMTDDISGGGNGSQSGSDGGTSGSDDDESLGEIPDFMENNENGDGSDAADDDGTDCEDVSDDSINEHSADDV